MTQRERKILEPGLKAIANGRAYDLRNWLLARKRKHLVGLLEDSGEPYINFRCYATMVAAILLDEISDPRRVRG